MAVSASGKEQMEARETGVIGFTPARAPEPATKTQPPPETLVFQGLSAAVQLRRQDSNLRPDG